MEMIAREDADVGAGEGRALPLDERVERGVGQAKGEEEAQPFIATDASRGGHTTPSELSNRSLRTRCSAPVTERPRIAARSPGKLNSRPSPPWGPSAWR